MHLMRIARTLKVHSSASTVPDRLRT
jgi:hypothetical protein